MPEDRSRPPVAARPLATFRFRVTWGSAGMDFVEVSGLDAGSQVIEYRPGNRPGFSPIKTPGLHKAGEVTLKRGVFKGDPRQLAWLQAAATGRAEPKPVTVTLVDEGGHAPMVWRLTGALPTKFVASDLSATGNEVAVEAVVLAYDGLTVENA